MCTANNNKWCMYRRPVHPLFHPSTCAAARTVPLTACSASPAIVPVHAVLRPARGAASPAASRLRQPVALQECTHLISRSRSVLFQHHSARADSVRHSSMCAFSSAFSAALPSSAAGGHRLPQTGQAAPAPASPTASSLGAEPAADAAARGTGLLPTTRILAPRAELAAVPSAAQLVAPRAPCCCCCQC